MRRAFVTACFLGRLGAAATTAQIQPLSDAITLDPPPFMVKDIGATEFWDFDLGYAQFAELNGVFYFGASDGIHGNELWRTDATVLGTWMLTEVCPGYCDGLPYFPTTVGSQVFFGADDGEHGNELWVTDGTPAGTHLVADISPGLPGSFPWRLMAVGSRVVFLAGDGLWGSDGTAAGTEKLIDNAEQPQAVMAGYAYVTSPAGLWRTDGTVAGTELVKALNVQLTAPATGLPLNFAETNGLLVFCAAPLGSTALALWRTDGTDAGTTQISPVQGHRFIAFDNDVFFASPNHELWRTDGTPGGTSLVKTLPDAVQPIGIAGGFFLFRVYGSPRSLWRSDGSEAGTEKLIDLPTSSYFFSSLFLNAVASGGKLFFAEEDDLYGTEPWVSDGTALGTFRLADFNPGTQSSLLPMLFIAMPAATPAGILNLYMEPQGIALWASDGEADGNVQLLDPDQQTPAIRSAIRGHFFDATDHQGRLASSLTSDGLHWTPWVSDGTGLGTQELIVTPTEPSSVASSFASTSRGLFFHFESQLWFSDGSALTPQPIAPVVCCQTPTVAFGADAIFADNGLFRTDGDPAHTATLTPTGIQPTSLGLWGSTILFGAGPSGGGTSNLWSSNGTPAGTAQLTNSLSGGPTSPDNFQPLGTIAVFMAFDPTHGRELWRTDGTEEGTYLVKDILPGPEPPFLSTPFPPRGDFFVSDGSTRAYLSLDDGSHGQELWTTDGTESGTVLVQDIAPGPAPGLPTWLTLFRGKLFFAADDGVSGRELWTSDGTPGGTHLVVDLRPGPRGSLPNSLAVVGERLWFSATDGFHGMELWSTDGTAAGTVLASDIVSGPQSASPEFLTPSGPYLYFTANDATHGFELWAKTIPSRALAASSIHVDDNLANANGLWELGESVKLQPVWENLSISNITSVTATASGTNGAQCSDGAATYGTFAPLDLRSCLSTGNCYAATLSGPRPSLHWDVALHETLSTGKVHDWPIHIAGSFDDIADGDAGYADVEAFLHANLTAGCSATSFCPQDVVTRAQAALFLSLGLAQGDANLVPFTGSVPGRGAYDCTDNGVSVFSDVDPEDPFCRFIHDLAARGVSDGCSIEDFCPENALARAQLALLLGKALAQGAIPVSFSGPGGTYDCSPTTPDIHFSDVDENSAFCAAAHYLWARGVSQGCDGSSFCPDGAVTRVALAGILVEGFALQLP